MGRREYYLGHFYDCEPPLIIFKLDQVGHVGNGRQRNGYVCLYSHNSYIVMDPVTFGSCLGSFARQKNCTK